MAESADYKPRPRADGGYDLVFCGRPVIVRSSLAHDASVNGHLSFTRPTRIDGKLHGEVRSSDLLVVGETGVVNGTVRAAKLLVLGHVHGDAVGAERIEIAPGGWVHGDVEARSFIVREGGMFDGDCRIAPPIRATVHILHPRSAPSGEALREPVADGS